MINVFVHKVGMIIVRELAKLMKKKGSLQVSGLRKKRNALLIISAEDFLTNRRIEHED